MKDRSTERTHSTYETKTDLERLGQSEELALAALSRQLDLDREPAYTPITEEEISSRDAQRLTTNSRHNLEFFKQRFPHRFCYDGAKKIVGFPRADVEQYIQNYREAQLVQSDYTGRRITSFASDTYPLATIFSVMRDIGIPIRLFVTPPTRQIVEYIDEDFIELLELGLAESGVSESIDNWRPQSLKEQLAGISAPERSGHRPQVEMIYWDDDLVQITRVPPKPEPASPPWLFKQAQPDVIKWQPRYLRELHSLDTNSVPLAQAGSHLGSNATIALAAHHQELIEHMAIGLDESGELAIAVEHLETLSDIVAKTEYVGPAIPDNWQTLEDVARDANVKLTGEEGLEAWVAEGHYGPDHIITLRLQNRDGASHLTFCSPQLARVIVDWVVRERQRLEQAIALAAKYGRPVDDYLKVVEPEVFDAPSEDEDESPDPIEELRAKLQSLETFAAQHALNVQWVYELINAHHDAYIVDYLFDGKKQRAHFATTEGLEYLLQNLAPPDMRTAHQVCDMYGIPLYLFSTYARGIEASGYFLSAEPSANVEPMPHYSPGQVNDIITSYYQDVADKPVRLVDISAQTGQTVAVIKDYLARHGVYANANRTVLRRAALKYINEHQDIAVADETAYTPTLFFMRTKEVRRSELTHTDLTAMCYELGIELVTLENQSAKKTTQHIPASRAVELQQAIERYYTRSR